MQSILPNSGLNPVTVNSSQPLTALEHIMQSGEVMAYHSLRKESDRELVRCKLDAMLRIEALCADGMTQKLAIKETAKRFEGRRGFSLSKLSADFKLWRNGGRKVNVSGKPSGEVYEKRSWRMFLPKYTNGKANAALKNDEFVRFIQRLFSDTCREDATGNALHERLLDKWFAGENIPGYGTVYQFCTASGRPVPTGHLARAHADNYPKGWSPENLRRMLPRSKAKRTYLQRGEHAAHSHWGDQLLRDRSKLMPFQLITFDDVRFDLKVIQPIPGKAAQVVYPEAIFCLDVATGMILSKAVLGTYKRDQDGDGGRAGSKRGFQHADMRWIMTKVLEQYGIPQDWTMHVLLENASASMSSQDQMVFEQRTGIKFETTGLIRSKLTASGFVEQGGMPWQKGWIEAIFRLVHTRINHLPGTVGRRYDLTDGRRADQERYTLNQIKDAHEKGISIEDLKLPLLTVDQFHTLLDDYVERINWRTRHNLQGFEQVHEFEYTDGQYIRHDDPRAGSLINVGAKLSTRMESPSERFERLMHGHRKPVPVHPRQLYPLSLDKRVITVRSEAVTFKVRGSDDLVFRDSETAHHLAEWNGRKKALIGFLSTDKSQVHLFTNDQHLTYICSPRSVKRIDITDQDAIAKRSGEVHRGREQVRQYAAELCHDQEHDLAAMRQHNDRLLNPDRDLADTIEKAESKTAARKRASRISDEEADAFFAIAETGAATDDEDVLEDIF